MKQLIILIMSLLAFEAGHSQTVKSETAEPQLTNEQIARILIKQYVHDTLNDYIDYDTVSYSKLVPLKKSVKDDETYLTISNEIERKKHIATNTEIELLKRNLERYKTEYEKPTGFYIVHRFRAKDKADTIITFEYFFRFDSEMAKIVLAEDVTKKQ